MPFKGRKILITGGAGFIGSNLAIRLARLGAKLTVLDAFLPGLGGNAANLRPVEGEIRFERVDLRDLPTLPRFVEGQDYIFNLAGQVSHQDSITDPFSDLELNARAHLNLLEACRRHNPQAVIVHTSTRQVYGVPQYLPVDEKHPIAPVDINGIHTFSGEHYHTLYARVHGLKTVSLRLTNTYGPRQMIRHPRQGFIAWFISRALLGETIRLFGGGQQIRDFNYVDDVVEALLAAAQQPACFGEVFNLSGEAASLESIAELLIRLSGKGSIQRVPFPEELKRIDIGDYQGNSEKFFQVAGWKAKVLLEAGLARTVEFYNRNWQDYLDIES